MIFCPKCKESLGDNITTCPFCFHEITDYERVLIAKKQREEEDEARYDEIIRCEEFSKMRMIWMLGTIISAILFYLVFTILLFAELTEAALAVFTIGTGFIAVMSLYLILIKKVNNCPHCGKYLFRNWGPYCQWCSGRIR
jgi:hypothetical protein